MKGLLGNGFSLPEYEVTDESQFRQRRQIIKSMAALPLTGLLSGLVNASCEKPGSMPEMPTSSANSLHQISHYNNFYEFSTNKEAIAILAQEMKLRPWTVEVSGEVESPAVFDIETLTRRVDIVERIYRFRCVEGWSMVIPWNGFQLCNLLAEVKPTSRAKYVQFVSRVDQASMIGLSRTGLEFPYSEALRLDEAMHPLVLLATGIYGKDLPAQNGAPLRLVVPWKYGFKSAKSIVKIIVTEHQPRTSWNAISPSEYGFYANVNPDISHPRWSQRKEHKIGELKKKKTLMFNGYEAQVAQLYDGMDLKEFY